MKVFTIVAVLLINLASCKSSKIEDIATTTAPYITLKSGGGFAGKYTTYLLFENGQIFEQKSEFKSSEPVGSIKKSAAEQIFLNYKVLDLANADHKHYGNYTYTIMMKDRENTHQIIWEKDQEGTDSYQLFYKNAMQAIKSSKNFKPEKTAQKQ